MYAEPSLQGSRSIGVTLMSSVRRTIPWGLALFFLLLASGRVTAAGPAIKTIAAGSGHTVALKTDGSLWAWGDNTYGQLGDGTTVIKPSPDRKSVV